MRHRIPRRQFLSGSTAMILGAGLVRPAWPKAPRVPLPIPALIDGTNEEPVELTIRSGSWSFMPGMPTPTLGFNQDYLGPTIRTRQGSEFNLHYKNTLAEGVAVHGHGLHVPGRVDGGPQLQIAPGDAWQPRLSIAQPAATCWYHSHTHGRTGHQVYHGLAGLLIIDDEQTDALDLPIRYGVDDLPVIIQDRTFDAKGRLVYSLQDAGEDGWLGDTAIINGAMNPMAMVPAGKVRLRILNGANARFYILAFSDQRVFHKIASDGGLLAAPVPLTTMEMAPGERCEIVVDLADGRPVDLLTYFEDEVDDEEAGVVTSLRDLLSGVDKPIAATSLSLVVAPSMTPNVTPLPSALASIVRPRQSDITRTRDFVLGMGDGDNESRRKHAGHTAHRSHAEMDMTINGAVMDMSIINERVKLGVWERWRVRSDQGAHPFHVHGCSFLVEQNEGEAVSEDQRGWKDTVVLDDDGWSEFAVRFDHPATEQFPYMYHCHILEHEDAGMMGQFTVT